MKQLSELKSSRTFHAPKRMWRAAEMSRTLEKAIHDCCMALFTVGMIGTLWHVGLAQLADVPTQNTGTQRVVRVR
jgi:hypothetical protein|tara:strand:+ start:118 stop:342 length:225 start_codon:yes stop_codon:yes gene_type:complete